MSQPWESYRTSVSDTFRCFYRNALTHLRESPVSQAFREWKAQNEGAWNLTTVFAEEFFRVNTRGAVADLFQQVLLLFPQVPLLHALAERYDRGLQRSVNEYFLSNSWILRYIQWLLQAILPPAESPNDADAPPVGFRFPNSAEAHLLNTFSDFISGELLLPRVSRWIPMADFRSPFPSKSTAVRFYTLSIISRGIGELPGLLLNHPGLSHWGSAFCFTMVNIHYVKDYFYPSLAEGDATDIANASFKNADLYAALDVTPSAQTNEILRAYKRKSLEYHPDRNVQRSESERFIVQEKFKVINEAKRILADPRSRFIYDQGLYTQSSAHTFRTEDVKFEHIEPMLQQFFSRDMWGLRNPLGLTMKSAIRSIIPLSAIGTTIMLILPLCIQVNIAYWQHLATDSGSLMVRVLQRVVATLLV